jgi:hypothetical protein
MRRGDLMGVYREQIFSPGKVLEDAAIMDAVLEELAPPGCRKTLVLRAEDLEDVSVRPGMVLSMAQSEHSLHVLEGWEKSGTRIFNSVESVRNCYRKTLIRRLLAAGVPLPPSRIMALDEVAHKVSFRFSDRYWLKRGDVHAIQADDVVCVALEGELERALIHFHDQQVDEVLVQEHVEGDVVKFYGVGPGEYFEAFSVSSGKRMTREMPNLSHMAVQSARAVGLEIFGGDAVLTPTGEIIPIDLNDWPSFSKCRRAAARGIAGYIMKC